MLKKLISAAVLLFSSALPAFAGACQTGTGLTYANTSCTQDDGTSGTVSYMFPSNWYSSVGNKYVPPGSFNIRLDPNGVYTFLYSAADLISHNNLFSVNPSEQVKVVLNFKVKNVTQINPWTHDCVLTNMGTINDPVVGFSEQIEASGGVTAAAYCHIGGATSPSDPEMFSAGDGWLDTQVIMELDGNSGTASVTSFGAHYHP